MPSENPVDLSDPHMRWVVALAHGFKQAGCTHAPIEPDPDVIRRCLETRDPAQAAPRQGKATEARTYKVRYRMGHSSGSCDDRFSIVRAYDAQDAAFQAMIDPNRHVEANRPHAYLYLLGVEPWEADPSYAPAGGGLSEDPTR